MSPLVWTPSDALALRCPVELVGTLRHDLDSPGPESDLAKQRLAAFALAQLARLAQGEGRAAVDAARLLLERCAPAIGGAPQDWPDWMTRERLGYRQEAGDSPAGKRRGDDSTSNH